jgi:glutathione peroxidase
MRRILASGIERGWTKPGAGIDLYSKPMEISMSDLLSIPLKLAEGRETTLNEYRGKVTLVVNVASKCGLTKQYEGLEKLYEDKRERGFVIAAFPANNFKEQEPGTDAEIVAFCTSTYDVKFPIFSKLSVKGEDKHPLYKTLTAADVATTGDGPMRERLRGHGMEAGDEKEKKGEKRVLITTQHVHISWMADRSRIKKALILKGAKLAPKVALDFSYCVMRKLKRGKRY